MGTTSAETSTGSAGAAELDERQHRLVESLGLAETGEGSRKDRLDRITRLARTTLGMGAANITVLDGDRAWFPSAQGLPTEPIPRSETFCDTTVRLGEAVRVRDAAADPRFSSLPAVTHHGVRFAASEPLRDSLGNVVATLCVFDTEPRELTGAELLTLQDLASWAEQELVASTEMRLAGEAQASMLPEQAFRGTDWEIEGTCVPALAVGGDFFDYGVSHGVAHLRVGDVMGKGAAAALVGAGVRSALRGTREAVTAGVDLGITVTQTARSLLEDLERTSSFVTLFEAAIDLEDGHVRYVDGGCGLALHLHPDGSFEHLRSDDRPLGVLPDDHWTEHTFEMAPGDSLLVFSDGILDVVGDHAGWQERVAKLAHAATDLPSLLGQVSQLARRRTVLDDVTVLGVKRRGTGQAVSA